MGRSKCFLENEVNRFKLLFRGNRVWIALSTLFVFQVLGVVDVLGSTSFLQSDATTRELAVNYSVVEVREAIVHCRAGKFPLGIPVLKQYAEQEDVAATYVMANLYYHGTGVENSESLAIEMLKRNIAANHLPSMIRLGEIKEKQSPAEALQLYKQAAAANHAAAHLKLGDVFEKGLHGTRANRKLAFRHYEKAHQAKSAMGTFQMARCYDEGVGVSPNALESTRLFRQAAMSGAGLANVVVARRYFEGKGVEADPVAAVGWLTRGSQAGSTEAMVLLGERFEYGEVIGKDINRAGQLYSAAANLRDPVGAYRLAMLYKNGTGTRPDPVRAYVLLHSAKAYPKAAEELEQLGKSLSEEQMAFAQKKIDQAAKQKK